VRFEDFTAISWKMILRRALYHLYSTIIQKRVAFIMTAMRTTNFSKVPFNYS
jgi:hypothetical protein